MTDLERRQNNVILTSVLSLLSSFGWVMIFGVGVLSTRLGHYFDTVFANAFAIPITVNLIFACTALWMFFKGKDLIGFACATVLPSLLIIFSLVLFPTLIGFLTAFFLLVPFILSYEVKIISRFKKPLWIASGLIFILGMWLSNARGEI
ncbi:MAG: hypothetical protein JNM12_15020 [Alphaproteobacteria bacterium]|nr:hypothetical protein [Alphaproteobacteria bacterium]